MSDIALSLITVQTTLRETAKQSSALGIGLQNAAPGNKNALTPNPSIQYLLTVADVLIGTADASEKITADNDEEKKEKLLQLVRDAIQKDVDLRQQGQLGDKFRFVRDAIQSLLTNLEDEMKQTQAIVEAKKFVLAEDDMVVYVYLYNAQGLVFQTWQKMVTPAVMYEYSVNRPIYLDKAHVDAFIRAKGKQAQHGYLEIVVKKNAILPSKEPILDMLGHTLVKVKDGSLKLDRMIAFKHNGTDYVVGETGELKKR